MGCGRKANHDATLLGAGRGGQLNHELSDPRSHPRPGHDPKL